MIHEKCGRTAGAASSDGLTLGPHWRAAAVRPPARRATRAGCMINASSLPPYISRLETSLAAACWVYSSLGRTDGRTDGNMREIVHIQAGQCGNQIGTKVGHLHPSPASSTLGHTLRVWCLSMSQMMAVFVTASVDDVTPTTPAHCRTRRLQ